MEKEQMMTGEHDGGDMKIGGKKRKLISKTGAPAKKHGKKKHHKKAHHKKVSEK